MGDLGAGKKNGVVQEDHSFITNPDPSTISNDFGAIAEEAVQEVIYSIHPNLGSEEKRKDIIDYMQRLFKCTLGFEVVPFGSVPLKTYLPDGDIDLTVLSNPCVENYWFTGVLSVLLGEEHNENAEYEVKDTQLIDAEVKVVKCLVHNIVIDISFNQMGGISTLCFLEKVDQLIGKDHLFKRSIILIKSWCYYESRILASNHGLLSTYAVETLVLCIFQMFHSSLDTPFLVFYRFLDYFSKFDWENYGISVNGPFRKSFLPDIVVERPENHANNLLFDEEFFRNCIEMFTIPPRDSVSNSRAFQPKHLNIIDPLRENNNLGRSVHIGNFYRIRCAFQYGARKLGGIMSSSPVERFADEIKKFFSSTLQRYTLDSQFILEGSRTLFSNEGCLDNSPVSSPKTSILESESVDLKERDTSIIIIIDTEPLNPLADLTGDFDSHIRSLSYWSCCNEHAFIVPMSPVLHLCQYPLTIPFEPFHQPFHYNNMPSSYSFANSSPTFGEHSIHTSLYAPEGNWNNQGTVLPPFPNINPSSRDRPVHPGKAALGGFQIQTQVETFSNGFVETGSSGKAASPKEASKAHVPYQAYRKTGVAIGFQSRNPKEEDGCTGVNLSKLPSSEIEFGSLGSLADDVLMISGSTVQDKGKMAAASSLTTPKQEGDEDSIFYLKEEEFPVLSVRE